MKRITKANSKKFVKEVTTGLLMMGATQLDNSITDRIKFTINTIVGVLNISVDTDNVHTYSVFAKFEDVDKAKEKFNCNPFSGKYNFHIGSDDVDTAIELAYSHIEMTLDPEKLERNLKEYLDN